MPPLKDSESAKATKEPLFPERRLWEIAHFFGYVPTSEIKAIETAHNQLRLREEQINIGIEENNIRIEESSKIERENSKIERENSKIERERSKIAREFNKQAEESSRSPLLQLKRLGY